MGGGKKGLKARFHKRAAGGIRYKWGGRRPETIKARLYTPGPLPVLL
jgi:hypothetical protein